MAARPFSRHLAELVTELAGRVGDRTALVSGERSLTYAELDERAGAVAGGFRDLGVERGDTVGLLCTNRWEWVVAALGAMRLGARVATFNTFARAWDLEYMLGHSGAELLVTLDRFRARDYLETIVELVPELNEPGFASARFPRLRDVVVIGDADVPAGARRFSDLAAEAPAPVPVSAADDAFVLYTSGSSARPKAVPLQHYGIVENGFQIGERMGLGDDDRVWVSVPLFWAYGAANALPATLTHGAALILQPAFDPGEALDLIEGHGATAGYTLPNMTSALIGHPEFTPERTRTLRRGLTLGTPTDVRRAAEGLGMTEVANIYGGTETYGNCCVTPSAWPLERRADSQGPPLPGVALRVVDPETGAELAHDETGELRVRGYVTRGYLDGGGSEAFTADGWFRTGDLAAVSGDGCLRFSARATDMIKAGGINVAPSEVEEFVALHPDVRDVAVVGVPDPVLDQVVVAFVVPRAGTNLTGDAVRAYCRDRIAAYKVPARVHILDDLPKTDTGKLARGALAALDRPREAEEAR